MDFYRTRGYILLIKKALLQQKCNGHERQQKSCRSLWNSFEKLWCGNNQ